MRGGRGVPGLLLGKGTTRRDRTTRDGGETGAHERSAHDVQRGGRVGRANAQVAGTETGDFRGAGGGEANGVGGAIEIECARGLVADAREYSRIEAVVGIGLALDPDALEIERAGQDVARTEGTCDGDVACNRTTCCFDESVVTGPSRRVGREDHGGLTAHRIAQGDDGIAGGDGGIGREGDGGTGTHSVTERDDGIIGLFQGGGGGRIARGGGCHAVQKQVAVRGGSDRSCDGSVGTGDRDGGVISRNAEDDALGSIRGVNEHVVCECVGKQIAVGQGNFKTGTRGGHGEVNTNVLL